MKPSLLNLLFSQSSRAMLNQVSQDQTTQTFKPLTKALSMLGLVMIGLGLNQSTVAQTAEVQPDFNKIAPLVKYFYSSALPRIYSASAQDAFNLLLQQNAQQLQQRNGLGVKFLAPLLRDPEETLWNGLPDRYRWNYLVCQGYADGVKCLDPETLGMSKYHNSISYEFSCPNNKKQELIIEYNYFGFRKGKIYCRSNTPVTELKAKPTAQSQSPCGNNKNSAPNSSRSNPILTSTGCKSEEVVDYASNDGLSLVRNYRSDRIGFTLENGQTLDQSSSFGLGWANNQLANAYYYPGSKLPDGTYLIPPRIAFSRPDGGLLRFELDVLTTSPTYGKWLADADVTDSLTVTTNNGTPTGTPTNYVLNLRDSNVVEAYNAQGQRISSTNAANQTTSYSYTGNLLTNITNYRGRSLSLSYITGAGGVSLVSQVTDPAGNLIKYSYDAQNRLVGVQSVKGNTTYHYDEAAYNPNASVNPHRLTGITDGRNIRYASFGYNSAGQAISSEHAGAVDKSTFSYSMNGSAVSSATITNPLGGKETLNFTLIQGMSRLTSATQNSSSPVATSTSQSYTYDANANVTRWYANGEGTCYEYGTQAHDKNLPTRRMEGVGTNACPSIGGALPTIPTARNYTTQWHTKFSEPVVQSAPLLRTNYTYQGDGVTCVQGLAATVSRPLVCSIIETPTLDANGSQGAAASADTNSPARTTSYTYNAQGQLLTITDPKGLVTTYSYYTTANGNIKAGDLYQVKNALGHTSTINAYNAHGQATQIVDANGTQTNLSFDLAGRLITRSRVANTPTGNQTLTTSYSYDTIGQLTQISYPNGYTQTYTYDDARRLTQISDNRNNQLNYSYNNNSQPTQTSLGNAGQILTTLKQEYDQLGRVVSIANPANQTWQASYDSNGNATQAKAPNGTTLNQSYDALSRVVQTSQTGSNGNGGTTTQTITNSYNAQDLIKQITDPKTLNTAYGLDGFGQTKQQDSPDTKQTVATYDNNGNVLTKTDAKGQTTSYTYDALNRLTQTLYHDGSKVIYTYDTDTVTNLGKVGRLTNISERNPANQQTAAWHAIYDGFGRIVQTDTIQGGVTLVQQYTYNTKGQLTSQSYPSGRLINYQYDLTGQLTGISTTVTTNTGTTTTQVASNITYHANGQIKSYTVNGTTNKVFTRSLDGNGRLSSYTSSHLNDGTPVATPLTYDANGRLTQLAAQTYEYDALDRLTKATIGDEVQTYTYDNTGNRLTNQSSKAGSVLALMSYSYDAVSHRLTNINTTIAAKTTAQAQGFDANGNTTSDGNSGGTNYTYDARNRLIKATNASATANYTINDQGQRTRKLLTQAGTTTDISFVYDLAGQLIAEYPTTTPNQPRQEIVWLGNLPITVFDRNTSGVITTNTIYPDHLGTPRLIVNSANATVWKWQNTDAFGNNPATNETIKFNLRFPGQYFDTETGLHYNWNRDYNPKLGRYIQSDPIGLEGGISTYGYVENDPLSEIDPEGLRRVNPGDLREGLNYGGGGGVVLGGGGVGARISGGGTSVSAGRISVSGTNFGTAVIGISLGIGIGSVIHSSNNAKNESLPKAIPKVNEGSKNDECNDCNYELHHSDPKFLGGLTEQFLTRMTQADHRALHKALNDFLRQVVNAKGKHMRPQRGNSGAQIRNNFDRSECLKALAEFYRGPGAQFKDAVRDFFNQHPGL